MRNPFPATKVLVFGLAAALGVIGLAACTTTTPPPDTQTPATTSASAPAPEPTTSQSGTTTAPTSQPAETGEPGVTADNWHEMARSAAESKGWTYIQTSPDQARQMYLYVGDELYVYYNGDALYDNDGIGDDGQVHWSVLCSGTGGSGSGIDTIPQAPYSNC